MSLAAQGLAFAAFIAFFAAASFWPMSANILKQLDNSIYLQEHHRAILQMEGLKSWVSSIRTDSTPYGYLPGVVSGVLALSAASAVIRGRWLFAALAAAFFVVPWGVWGHRLPLSPYALTLLALAAFAFHAPLSKRWIIVGSVLTIIGAPLIFGVVHDVSKGLFPGSAERYLIVNSAQFTVGMEEMVEAKLDQAQQNGSATISRDDRYATQYVAAQMSALNGNALSAAAALSGIDQYADLMNPFDRERIDAIRNYATEAGALGQKQQERVASDITAQTSASYVLILLGVISAVAVPLVNMISASVHRRGRRVSSMVQELEGIAAIPKSPPDTFGTSATRGRPTSMIMGERAITAIAVRLRFYCRWMAVLAGLSALLAAASYWIWVPDPSLNLAFNFISLPNDAIGFANDLKLDVRIDEQAGAISLWWYAFIGLSLALIIIATRKSRTLGLAGTAIFLLLLGLNAIRLPDHSRYQLPVSAFPPAVRASIHQAAISARKSDVGIQFVPEKFELRGTASLNGVTDPPQVSGDAAEMGAPSASYILAQIAYLEDNAADTATSLNRVEFDKSLRPRVHLVKLEAMKEWLSAKGVEVGPTWFSNSSISFARLATKASLGLSIALLLLSSLLGIAIWIAYRRAGRIQTLMEERERLA
ncbi:hypothetical protein [Rhizobium sp. S163]|uniref:hypothetical protein n=1 Tax=Rhizobium sp. S163 TaxID=3055039 RepID=UPI0025A9F805|nr:hypothetical protein [Rhizobium sp. S163]MDM9648888.1 hypothetical protein [Rhizobium sp. S163]